MQEMIDRIAAQVGIAPDLAHKATSMIVDFIAKQAPAEYVDKIRAFVPGFDEIAAAGAAHSEAAEGGAGGGGLMGALGGLMSGGGLGSALGSLMGGSEGGGLGAALALVGNLEKDGLDLGQVQQVATGLVGELRQSAGAETVDALLAEIPGVGRFLA